MSTRSNRIWWHNMFRERGFSCSFLRHNRWFYVNCTISAHSPEKYDSQAQKHLQASPCKMVVIFWTRDEEGGKIPFKSEEMHHHNSVFMLFISSRLSFLDRASSKLSLVFLNLSFSCQKQLLLKIIKSRLFRNLFELGLL